VAEKKYLSMDEILAVDDIQYADVEAFGGLIRIGSLSAGDMIDWIEANEDPAKKRIAGINLIVKSLVDETGARIGRDENTEVLKKKDNRTLGKIVNTILELNGMKPKAAADAKNGSSGAPSDASPIASPSPQGA
jgi:hypothetical protein